MKMGRGGIYDQFSKFINIFIGERDARGTKISRYREISRILPVFGEIIVYLRKVIVNSKNNNCEKSTFSRN